MKHTKTLWLMTVLLVLSALVCAPALAKVVSPGEDFYYLDKANVLSEALEGEIYFSNKLLYDACGAQLVVVTVDTTGREAIDDYAYELFNSWGIGDAAQNNGFLLLLAIGDDDYYARTGSGLDRRFSASAIKELYDDYLEGDFAAKRYDAGVKKFFEAAFKRISDTYGASVTVEDGIADYNAYIAQNQGAKGFGGYTGSRRTTAVNTDYHEVEKRESHFGLGLVIFLLLVVLIIVLISKGRRARRRVVVMPPPPPPPRTTIIGGYRPSRTIVHSAPIRRGPSGFGSAPTRSSRPSSIGGGSIGRSSSRPSFGGGGRSSGFGGGMGGGGRSSGGGAGRGRH